MDTLRIVLSQINTTVGDIDGNTRKICAGINAAQDVGADLVAFPELSVTGYPPEDLLLKPQFIRRNLEAINIIASETPSDLVAVVGFADRKDDLFNAAAILHDGRQKAVYHKCHLPNYGVFDEDRYFAEGKEFMAVELKNAVVGITICEDIWSPDGPARAPAIAGGAQVILNINSSPYRTSKREWREKMISVRAVDNLAAVAYLNLVGGQDELLFDGGSFVTNEQGIIVARGKQFQEDFLVADINLESIFSARLHDTRRRKAVASQEVVRDQVNRCAITGFEQHATRPPIKVLENEPLERLEEIYNGLVLGVQDYVNKNGFEHVVIGLSGGIDSTLTACIAVDALGKEAVTGVSMPSQYSSDHSKEDAARLAQNLGIEYQTIPIATIFSNFIEVLSESFDCRSHDKAEENIQARIRGTILMGLSNKFGWLVLATGNKSEASVGYCTLYGDTAGGFCVIKDVYKMLVYDLAKHVNRKAKRQLISSSIFEKPPSAELRPEQTDQDSLPPYPMLDEILRAYVEEDKEINEIVLMGFDPETVRSVARLVDLSEYKRRQIAPGVKISHRALGKDRRLPITNRFHEWERDGIEH